MNEYKASNGVKITRYTESLDAADGDVSAAWMAPRVVDALREFFRAEEDERLGRWRWPENPDYVVYHWGQPLTAGVVVTSESAAVPSRVLHRDADPENRTPEYRAARAYFDAHPEPKPWHDAKPKEVWEFRTADDRQYALGWVALDGSWDVIDPRGALIPNTADPIGRLVENGYPKFATATAVRYVPAES